MSERKSLRQLRIKRGMTREELAQMMGVTVDEFDELLKERDRMELPTPSRETIIKMAQSPAAKIDWLTPDKEDDR